MKFGHLPVIVATLSALQPAHANDLFVHGGFSGLASDQRAQARGDILTIVIYENASASNKASTGSSKKTSLAGTINAGSSLNETGQLGLSGGTDNTGSTGRSGQMVAQISVTVDEVLPNGDLHVAGEQTLKINGELTHIRIRGRVRPSDISSYNAVVSSRLADAAIDYDGSGFVTRSSKPGIISRLFNFLGLM
jgi:flagellar L-ring protein precursor FlgH